jgi:hypothetical protein
MGPPLIPGPERFANWPRCDHFKRRWNSLTTDPHFGMLLERGLHGQPTGAVRRASFGVVEHCHFALADGTPDLGSATIRFQASR